MDGIGHEVLTDRLYNKGITSFWKETGAASVMIARAAEWNASVFRWSIHKLRIRAKQQQIIRS